jgi:hypothetical protein
MPVLLAADAIAREKMQSVGETRQVSHPRGESSSASGGGVFNALFTSIDHPGGAFSHIFVINDIQMTFQLRK